MKISIIRREPKKNFFDLFTVAAAHLKACFPHLKIGGPAATGYEEWISNFLSEMSKRNVPIDFFSWHIYCTEPKAMLERAEKMKKLLIENGYGSAECILNEWNYIKGWEDEFVRSIKTIHAMKGAAFTMTCMTVAQHSSIDMLMYYDTRPTIYCGAFDFYTYEPLKGYYAIKWYGMFYDMVNEIECAAEFENIYTLCGCDENGKTLLVITYYTDDDTASSNTLKVDFGRTGKYDIYLLDEEHDAEVIEKIQTY